MNLRHALALAHGTVLAADPDDYRLAARTLAGAVEGLPEIHVVMDDEGDDEHTIPGTHLLPTLGLLASWGARFGTYADAEGTWLCVEPRYYRQLVAQPAV